MILKLNVTIYSRSHKAANHDHKSLILYLNMTDW